MKHVGKWGWIPDVPDYRDYRIGKLFRGTGYLPRSIDLRPGCSPVENQSELGSCTANALVGCMEFLLKKDGACYVDLSRLFVYYGEREMQGTIDSDSGAMLRDGIKFLAKTGVCTEATWPYNIWRFRERPPKEAYDEAQDRQILHYYRLDTIKEMKTCLANGIPFSFGFAVYQSFMTDAVARTGQASMPRSWSCDKFLGGHAVMCVGYNDDTNRFLVRNSWGKEWGMDGYFTLPYEYLKSRDLSDDFWAITKQEVGK